VGERAKAASSANGAKARARRAASRPARRMPAPAAQEPVPRQGFESEGERLSGTVQPPGGSEFLAGAFELAGELAKAGISTGERLLKDALGRLPLS
jgi:hypothetical protein